MTQSWQFWAFTAAVFAALTAIFAKVGISEINSDMATLIRTCIILCVTAGIVVITGQWQEPSSIPAKTSATVSGGRTGPRHPSYPVWLEKSTV